MRVAREGVQDLFTSAMVAWIGLATHWYAAERKKRAKKGRVPRDTEKEDRKGYDDVAGIHHEDGIRRDGREQQSWPHVAAIISTSSSHHHLRTSSAFNVMDNDLKTTATAQRWLPCELRADRRV